MTATTTGLQIATFGLALLGFLVSAILAVVKIWETFFQRSRLQVEQDWIEDRNGEKALWLTVANTGYKREGIREIRFRTAAMVAGSGMLSADVHNALPIMLEPADISCRLEIAAFGTNDLSVALKADKVRLLDVVDTRGNVHTEHVKHHPVP